jgi:hypothetical protein
MGERWWRRASVWMVSTAIALSWTLLSYGVVLGKA